MMTRRWLVRVATIGSGGWLLAVGGCPARVQQEIETLLAPEVIDNALYRPFSVLYNIIGDLLAVG